MSLKFIRDFYGVSVKVGKIIKFRGDECVIKSGEGPYLKVVRIKDKQKLLLHPTWEVEYLEAKNDRT